MSFIILGDSFTFPEGNAATNRVFTYAKGLIENGISAHIICFLNEYKDEHQGIESGIQYYSPFGQKNRSKYFISRRYKNIAKYVKTYKLLKKINKSDPVLAITCYTTLLGTLLFSFFLARVIGCKLILEQSEHPLQRYSSNFILKILGRIRLFIIARICDNIFCISQYLVDFYSSNGVKKKKLFLLPSTVDPERFSENQPNPLPYEYVLYCGSLTIEKDGVNILIESFTKLSNSYPDLKLVLIGKGDTDKEEIAIRQLVIKLKQEERVVFLGHLSRNKIPAYLCNAKILALARPNSIIADAGFPSKLTEYLASGRPVAVTSTGEISNYLTHNVNAFIAEPGSIESFATVLIQILSDYAKSLEIGKNGKEIANTTFSYHYQIKRVIQHIYSLYQTRKIQNTQ